MKRYAQTYPEVASLLRDQDVLVGGKGSHAFYVNRDGVGCSVPTHGAMKVGTLKAIEKKLGVS